MKAFGTKDEELVCKMARIVGMYYNRHDSCTRVHPDSGARRAAGQREGAQVRVQYTLPGMLAQSFCGSSSDP